MQKVKAIQDDDCHWYVVPEEEVDEFNRLQEIIQGNRYKPEVEAEFEDKFSGYMTGGDLNNTQLWAEL